MLFHLVPLPVPVDRSPSCFLTSRLSQYSRDVASLALVFAALVEGAMAQCAMQWLPGAGLAGTDRTVRATMMWDRDGAGPMPPVLVVGGSFRIAGTSVVNGIATYDFVTGTWSGLGSGMVGTVQFGISTMSVNALATLPNGDLVAGGTFHTAGGVSANNIARWDGNGWSAFGSGTSGGGANGPGVYALTTLANGDLVVGGTFAMAGGVNASRLARWDGANWNAMWSTTSPFAGDVFALTTLANGHLVVGGGNSLARWDGATWSNVGSGGPFLVFALTTLANGDLIAGGGFTNAGAVSADHVARWDGANWSALGTGTASGVRSLTQLPNSDLVAGCDGYVARWDGNSWSRLGSVGGASSSVYAAATLPGGELLVGGQFDSAGAVGVNNLALWVGGIWTTLVNGMQGRVFALATMPNGDLIVGGEFTSVHGVAANNIARWDGTQWSPLGAGLVGGLAGATFRAVLALAVLPNGDLVAGGTFTVAGGLSANWIARWDGTAWSALGSGMTAVPGTERGVTALATLSNGDLVAGGNFAAAGGVTANNVARWDGTSWSPLGSGLPVTYNGAVRALTTLPNGDLVAGGDFTGAWGGSANHIVRWNGSSWSTLGSGMTGGTLNLGALVTLPNGDLVAGGSFGWAGGVLAHGVARWNGTSWSAFGQGLGGEVHALTALPDGGLIAGGSFGSWIGNGARRIARWNGATWSSLGAGMDGGAYDYVFALATMPNGEVVAGGGFTLVDGAVSAYVARLAPTCPAAAVSSGQGCTGSGGPNELGVTSLPWAGATFRSLATGLATNGKAVAVFGFSTLSLPIVQLHPAGTPGCTLLVNGDIVINGARGGGTVASALAIPAVSALAGGVFHHQVVSAEIDSTGNIAAITSTNALQLTIGAFQ